MLLTLHGVCARIAYLSGAGYYVDKLLEDMDNGENGIGPQLSGVSYVASFFVNRNWQWMTDQKDCLGASHEPTPSSLIVSSS